MVNLMMKGKKGGEGNGFEYFHEQKLTTNIEW